MSLAIIGKIISGGQTGTDRAGLDAAISHGIPVGGHCPKGRKAEDGVIPSHYPLVETGSPNYAVRTYMNVRESDGTLVLNIGPLNGGTLATVEYAAKRRKPCLVVQLDPIDRSFSEVADWMADNDIRTLNIAGPRESKAPGTYDHSLRFLNRLISLLKRRRLRYGRQKTTSLARGLFSPETWPNIFLVGGIVRDLLIGRESNDIDLASTLPQPFFESLGFRRIEGKRTAPIMFRHQPGIGKLEVTLLSPEESIEHDLWRRDFRCNALAMTLSGEIIDPLGGRRDIKKQRLRHCSVRSFVDDPLRMFRAFRFEADGWRMATETESLIMGRDWEETLKAIPVERFMREMLKALETREPGGFFRKMLELNVGRNFLPEIFKMAVIPAGPIEHHPEGDLFIHSCQVVERISMTTCDPLARFCAFFHDLGKLATDPALYPKHHGHDEAGFGMAHVFCDRLKLPASWKRALAWTNRLHNNANKWEELRDSTKIRMAEQAVKVGIAEILPLVSAADRPRSPAMPDWEATLRAVRMTTEELGIAPLQLEMMDPGKKTALILQKRVEQLRKALTKSAAQKKAPGK